MALRIGTVDIPDRIERHRYFRDLTYLELSALFAGPLKPSLVAKWTEVAPKGSIGLVAPWVLTHRQPPKAARLWDHDASVGDFRDSKLGRAALAELRTAVDTVGASHVIFRSPTLWAPSAANRDTMRRFFAEVATPDAVGATRVWVPDGLWETRTAVTFATELGVVCAFDPLVRAPEQPPEVHFDYEVEALYLRIAGLGRTGPIRSEKQEDLLALLMEYARVPATIAFESPARWADARNLKKLLDGVELDDADAVNDDDDTGVESEDPS